MSVDGVPIKEKHLFDQQIELEKIPRADNI
jgi:hypothetical protein